MTAKTDPPAYADHIVVAFDMISSSGVIEELEMVQDLRAFRNLLIALKTFLRANASKYAFRIYKFTGDGWILLFDPNSSGKRLLIFLVRLSRFFSREFSRRIARRLDVEPDSVGLTFGIDRGRLLKIRMLEANEYVGRALIVASRLQAAIRDKDRRPEYKALMTRRAFLLLRPGQLYDPKEVTRVLKNIRGGAPFRCWKIQFPA